MAGNHRQNVFLTANLFGDTAQNMDGQNFSPRFVPLSVPAGHDNTFALKSDGTVIVWGSNTRGALGMGPAQTNTNVPNQVPIVT